MLALLVHLLVTVALLLLVAERSVGHVIKNSRRH